jgi:hypothetical protein
MPLSRPLQRPSAGSSSRTKKAPRDKP